eukprot:CAMPEP_0172601048 /NCGR_PEP_ID=MMETSP1068-20121228/21201_1 /TAXON_ID=35684 /ORGANISM="Pseudopedinella elastica, Strain CCMP716" /LENGTH=363 /DNA_ID=CAMNT_0013401909 /DNA_START=333 /DNA_END=1421 /DNA_ORIENTATION=-
MPHKCANSSCSRTCGIKALRKNTWRPIPTAANGPNPFWPFGEENKRRDEASHLCRSCSHLFREEQKKASKQRETRTFKPPPAVLSRTTKTDREASTLAEALTLAEGKRFLSSSERKVDTSAAGSDTVGESTFTEHSGDKSADADTPQGVDEGKKNAKLTSEDVLKKRGWEKPPSKSRKVLFSKEGGKAEVVEERKTWKEDSTCAIFIPSEGKEKNFPQTSRKLDLSPEAVEAAAHLKLGEEISWTPGKEAAQNDQPDSACNGHSAPTSVTPDGRCGLRALLLVAGPKPPPGVNLAMGRDARTLEYLYGFKCNVLEYAKQMYDSGGEAQQIIDAHFIDSSETFRTKLNAFIALIRDPEAGFTIQ